MPFTYKYVYMHVLEIQIMSGLIGCVGYILYSTVVVYMFNFMTPKVLCICTLVLLCSFVFCIE